MLGKIEGRRRRGRQRLDGITNLIDMSLSKLQEMVMPSNLCLPLLLLPSIFPSIRFLASRFFTSGGQSNGASASTSVLPMNI